MTKSYRLEFDYLTMLHALGGKLHVMDYSIYSKIAARYGDNQPVGGVIFKNPCRSKSTGSHVSLDSYGRGDIGNILHQGGVTRFATKYRNKAFKLGYWNRPMPFPADVSKTWRAIKNAKSICFGVDNDPFSWMDRKYRVTAEVIEQMIESPKLKTLVINTRSDLVAHDEYIEKLIRLVAQGVNLAVFMHRPTINGEIIDDERCRILEPGCASLLRRDIAITRLREAGIEAHWANDEVKVTKQISRELGLDADAA